MSEVERLQGLIDAALAIHIRHPWHNNRGAPHSCKVCVSPWPCKTVRALSPETVPTACEGCAEEAAREYARLAQLRVDYPSLYRHERKNA